MPRVKKHPLHNRIKGLVGDLNLPHDSIEQLATIHEANNAISEGRVDKEMIPQVRASINDNVKEFFAKHGKDVSHKAFTRTARPEGSPNNMLEDATASKTETASERGKRDVAEGKAKWEAYQAKMKAEEDALNAAVNDTNKSDKKLDKYGRQVRYNKNSPAPDPVNPPPPTPPPDKVPPIELSGVTKIKESDAAEQAAKSAAVKAHNEAAAALRAADKKAAKEAVRATARDADEFQPSRGSNRRIRIAAANIKASRDLHLDITPEAAAAGKAEDAAKPAQDLKADLRRAAAENRKLRKEAAKKLAASTPPPAPPEVGTGEIHLDLDSPPPPPEPPAPSPDKIVADKPPVRRIEDVKLNRSEAADLKKMEDAALMSPEDATKMWDKDQARKAKRANPTAKKISSIFDELKTRIANKPEGPRAAKSRAAIVEAGLDLEKPPSKPPTFTSVIKGFKPGKEGPNAGASKFAISVEEDNLKRASKADTTPEVSSSRAKLRQEMDEAGRGLRDYEKRNTLPSAPKAPKASMSPLTLPEKPSMFPLTKALKDIGTELGPKAAATEKVPEWLGVARKAATAAEETSKVSKLASAGKVAGHLGKAGIVGLAIYGGIEALKKIGSKLKE